MQEALVDGDVLVYICGFAAEDTVYSTPDGLIFSTMGQAVKHCNSNEIERLVEAEPLSHVLYLVKNALKRIKDRTGARVIKVYLSGKGNFRNDIATIKPYKGNRSSVKPFHYNNIRDYLVNRWNAEVVDGIEADDALGINQSKDSCICTIDKDLDMVPGYHYNFQKDRLYDVPATKAVYNFYKQLLTGDPTDNIPGVPKVGAKTAQKILSSCKDEEDMYWACLETYATKYPRPFHALLENGQLLWIQRQEDEIWQPMW